MSSVHHSNPSVASGHRKFSLEAGETIIGASNSYVITKVLGEGSYGKVLECWNVDSHEKVAIKIMKSGNKEDTEHELSMLKAVSVVDADENHLVKFIEHFEYMGRTCLVFEKLDIDLFNLMVQEAAPMCLIDIRDIAVQLLIALDDLQGLAILHGDIKPDNIMLVNAEERPMKVKLVDFGLAVPACEIFPGMLLQPIGYRAPEVSLGLQYNEAVDVWGVGCVLAFLYLCGNPFPTNSEYQMMRSIVQTVGQPPDHLLSEGGYTWRFFTEEEGDVDGSRWRLMTPEEFSEVNGEPAGEEDPCFDLPGGLDELMEIYPVLDDIEWEERSELVDFLKGLLDVDPEQRLTPQEALNHPFITRALLSKYHLSHDPVNQEPLDQELLDQEALDQELLDQEPLDQELLDQEPWDQESSDQELLDQEPLDQELLDQEPWDQESSDQEPLDQEPWDQEPLDQEPWDQEPSDQELLDQEPSDQELLDQEPWDQELLDQEPWDQEPWDQEPLDQELLDQEHSEQEPWDQEPLDQEPWDQDLWDQEPLDQESLDQEPWDQEPSDQEPWDQKPLDQELWDQELWDQEPWDQEPLEGLFQDQTNDAAPEESDSQDWDSGFSEFSGPFMAVAVVSVIPVTEQSVDVEDEASGLPEEGGADEVLMVSTSTSRLKRFRKTMGRVFKTIRKTFCCCVRPKVEE